MITAGYGFCLFVSIQVYLGAGQLLPREELRNVTTCDFTTNVNVSCGSDEMIAVQSLYFWYHPSCESTCCGYDSSHSSVAGDTAVIKDVRRQCSGKKSCTLQLSGVRQFPSVGVKNPSYVVIQYYCINSSRTTSICSDTTLPSGGELLYLTNKGYPSVTTGDSTCSCSVEVYSCTSSINVYTIDADLYFETDTCEQSLDFADGRNATLKEVKCENYYGNEIDVSTLDTPYLKIDFIDNSNADQEGYFFFGIRASETNVAFKLNCAYEPQSTCFDCGTPNDIPNGRITLNDVTNTRYGAFANVTCLNGYDSNTETVSCLETGLWENATCSAKDCGEPYALPDGKITTVGGITTFGAKANVVCDQGYQIESMCNSSIEFQCGDGSCIGNSARCDSFPDCSDGLDELLCQNQISCPEGQKLCDVTCVDEQITCEASQTSDTEADTGTISCLVIGQWEITKCVLKACGELAQIENGAITLTVDGKTTYNSTANVTCNTGFTSSAELIACQADGSWEIGSCSVTDCTEPGIANGNVTLTTAGNTTYGSTAAIACDTGYTPSTTLITCKANSQWDSATCDINDCGTKPAIANGTVTLATVSTTTYGSTASVACDTGFTPSAASITCQANGQWESAICNINDCGTEPAIANGTVTLATADTTTYGSTATVSCDTGFTPSASSITCQANKQWESATCDINDCGTEPAVANGTVTLAIADTTTYGSTASVACDTGFTPSASSITCQANKQWESATCDINDCGTEPAIANGTVTLATADTTTYGSTATVSCDTGFTPSASSITCQANKQWESATCDINDCGTEPAIANGTLTLATADTTTYGSTATVSCDTGFAPSASSITCQANGQWESATCGLNDCGTEPAIANGTLTLATVDKTTYGSTATVSCDTGFAPSASSITCQANKQWESATCDINDCGTEPAVANGTVTLAIADTTTYGSTASVACDTGFTPSASSITCQANKQWESATCDINDCGTEPAIANGTLTLATADTTTYGSTATVSCDTGFAPSASSITCQANGQWESATCDITDCGTEPAIANGTLTLATVDKTTYGSTATVSCDTGFAPSASSITCQANGQWESATCDINDCGTEPAVANGTVTLATADTTTYGSTASVACDTGFTPSASSITCQANKQWESATCDINDCGTEPAVANGTVTLAIADTTTYGSTASVACDTGFTPSASSITCQANKQWESATCDINDCGTEPAIANGTVTLATADTTTYGSTATVSCDTGFAPSASSITCQANGQWESATCGINDCGTEPAIANGTLTLATADTTTYGSTATVSCDTGFAPSASSITCQANGQWESATCDINDCGTEPAVANGTVTLAIADTTTYGSTASVACDTGFTPSASSITCQANKQWESATCDINDCGTEPAIANGTVTLATADTTTYGSTATVSCDTGFAPSASSITCQANGQWESATCDINDCGTEPAIANGTLTLATADKTTYGSTATVSCDTGFAPSASSITCQANGQWESATCDINDCGTEPAVANGTVTLAIADTTTYGSTASVACDTGFTPSASSITCQANKQWESATCDINDCGTEPAIANGTVTLATADTTTYDCGMTDPISNGTVSLDSSTTTYFSTATVSCEQGFHATTESILCQADGTWEAVSCVITECGKPFEIANGTIKLEKEGGTTFVSTAVVQCDTGFNPSTVTISCLGNGTWETASCEINDCGTKPAIANGTVTLTTTEGKTTYGSLATVECDTGFTPSPASITCRANSQWESATCAINDCGTKPAIANGTVTLTTTEGKTTYGSSATVECDTGFTPSPASITCRANSQWESATCAINDCGTKPAIANGTVTLTTTEGKTTYGSSATVECDTGFTPSPASITCRANSQWESATCAINDCGTKPAIANGTVTLTTTEGKTTYGSSATVECDTGFTPSPASITCRANSQWESATCAINDCGTKPAIANGTVTLTTTEGKTTYGSSATVECDTGFTPSPASITCRANSQWESATCAINDCGTKPAIANGTVTLTTTEGKTTYGSSATVECDTGFTPSPASITCRANSQWESATCAINDCGTKPAIANGTVTLTTTEGKTTYGSSATVECDTGFTPSPASITCRANSQWESATCAINDCGTKPAIANGIVTLTTTEGKTTYGSSATVECDTGFTPSPASITCRANSQWESATCAINDCGTKPAIANGTVTLTTTEGKTTYGSSATVECDTGFTPSPASITCRANSQWESATCAINDCGTKPAIANGTVTLTTTEGKTTYGSSATVECDTGFTPSPASITCRANSQWESATCAINDCGTKPAIANGTVTLTTTEGKTTYGSSATVECDTGFTPSPASITCRANSQWESATCAINDCGTKPAIANGTVTLTTTEGKTTYGSSATVECDTGFTPSPASITCRANSQWESATCAINDCGTKPAIANGTVTLTTTEGKTTYGSSATVECDTGFTPSPASITCRANSQWESATCAINDCGTKPAIANGTVTLTTTEGKTTYGSSATVECDTGFTPSPASITCRANSQWESATCAINDCGTKPAIANGTVTLTTTEGKTTYGSSATVECDTGFTPSPASITCRANSQWESATCAINDCGTKPAIANGTVTLTTTEGKTTYGSSATVECDTGFTPSPASITCRANSQWESATCDINDCGTKPAIANGTVTLITTEGKTTYGSSATVECDTGFTPSPASITCRANSQWESATCAINDCGTKPAIANGTVTLTTTEGKTTYGSSATVECDTGFTPSPASITCRANSQWESATCAINDCGTKPAIANGTVTLTTTEGKTTYGSSATVECDTGFTPSPASITCRANSQWESATCDINECGKLPAINNGTIILAVEGNSAYRSTASVTCEEGFTASVASIACQADGSWETATCNINVTKECGMLPKLENGRIDLDSRRTYVGMTAKVFCNTGYKRSRTFIACLISGQWQNASCNVIDCGEPLIIRHGKVTVLDGSFTTYNSVARVVCDKGYKPEAQFVACMETGTWETGSCVPKGDEDIQVIILVAGGGVVLLIAIVLLVILIIWNKARKTVNLRRKGDEFRDRYSQSENMNSNMANNPGGLSRMDSFPIQEELFSYDEIPYAENGVNPSMQYDLPENEHVMSPDEINVLEDNVFRNHEPVMWHTDMHSHTGEPHLDFNQPY